MEKVKEKIKEIDKKSWIYALFYPVYIISFFLFEKVDLSGRMHIVHSPIDDMIPFISFFILFYVSWHVVIGVLAIHTIMFDRQIFKWMTTYFLICYIISFICYIVYPTGLELRPDSLGSGFFDWACSLIYSADTSTNVCPSMHISGALGLLCFGWNVNVKHKVGWRIFLIVLVILIMLSTVFLKQHSIIDVYWGLVLGVVVIAVMALVKKRKAKNG